MIPYLILGSRLLMDCAGAFHFHFSMKYRLNTLILIFFVFHFICQYLSYLFNIVTKPCKFPHKPYGNAQEYKAN